jgi:hypothetical protein
MSDHASADGHERDDAYHQVLSDGGILLTTEFRVKSEVMSRVESLDEDGSGIVGGEAGGKKEAEQWSVPRPSVEEWTRGWNIV